MTFHSQPINQVYKQLNTSAQGLTPAEAAARLSSLGPNELKKQKRVSLAARFFAQFKNLMVIVLLISALISFIVALATKTYSDLFEGGLIFIIVLINAIIGVFQEKRAEDAIALLNKRTEPFSKVMRGGMLIKVPSREVVVGDIVHLKAGDFVPADIRLTKTNNFKCEESALTGESQSVFKSADKLLEGDAPLAERENMCFSGTSCTFGNAVGVVVQTGSKTEMGKIANLLGEGKKEKTPLEKNIDKIGKVLTWAILVIVGIVFVAELLLAREMNFLDAFLTAVALAVAAIPESLPAVITIVMALGVERLAKHGAIVKTLSSVETLGCCNIICSDKTGTLTQNQMTVKDVFVNSSLVAASDKSAELEAMLKAFTLCNNAQIDPSSGIIGDATETSLLSFAREHYPAFERVHSAKRLREFPFDSVRKIMSVVAEDEGKLVMFSKGAYDYLIGRCTHYLEQGEVLPMTAQRKGELERVIARLGQKAERVLAVAQRELAPSELQTAAEENLVLVGLVGIVDPPRKEAKAAIKECKKAGLRTIMITGDHKETAFAIAKELGLASSRSEIITGDEIDQMSSKELARRMESSSVCARVTPSHKVKIVEALKKSGKIVAMTGDGVNDAPSIKKANIGVCMGKTGTDVTKSVSDLVITDDNFATIVVAVKQGRTIYANIQKIIQFLISTNAVEVLGIFVTTLLLRDSVFLLPSQILFINLVTDSFPAFALGLEKPEKHIMDRPPRDPKDNIFSGRVGTSILYQSFVQTLLVLVVFVVAIHVWGNQVASTMAFLIICLMQIIHAINCKSEDSIFKLNIFNNLSFNLSFLGLFALIMVVALVPPLQAAFSISSLSPIQWLIVAGASISIIPLVEICKLFVNLYYSGKLGRRAPHAASSPLANQQSATNS